MGHIFVNSSEVLTQCNHISEISSQLSLFDEKIKSTQRQLQRNMDLYRDDINTRFDKVLSLVSHDVIAIKQLGSSWVSILQQYVGCEQNICRGEFSNNYKSASLLQSGAISAAAIGAVHTSLVNHKDIPDETISEQSFSVLNFDSEDGQVSGNLANLSGHEIIDIAGINVETGVNAEVGSIEASADVDGGFYVENEDGTISYISGKVSAEAGGAVAEFDYTTTIGSEDYNGTVDANLDLLTADAAVAGNFEVGENGVNTSLKADVGASAVEFGGSVSINAGDFGLEADVSAEIGFGAYGELEFDSDEGELTIGAGLAVGVGGRVRVTIKVPKFLRWIF